MSEPQDKPSELFTDPKHVRGDLREVARAIHHKWDIPEAMFEALPDILNRILKDPEARHRDKIRAIEVFIRMHEQNRETDDSGAANLTTVVFAQVTNIRQVLQDDPGYINYLRDRVSEGNGHAGPVGGNNQQWAMGNGEAHEDGG